MRKKVKFGFKDVLFMLALVIVSFAILWVLNAFVLPAEVLGRWLGAILILCFFFFIFIGCGIRRLRNLKKKGRGKRRR